MQSTHIDAAMTPPKGSRPEHPLIPAGRVNGAEVFNNAGDKPGSVEDVAIDRVSGRVAYAIISFGGFFGLGERYHPIPWDLLRYDTERRGYVIPCDKDDLKDAPSFETDELSGWDDTDIREGIYSYYGRYGGTPYWMAI